MKIGAALVFALITSSHAFGQSLDDYFDQGWPSDLKQPDVLWLPRHHGLQDATPPCTRDSCSGDLIVPPSMNFYAIQPAFPPFYIDILPFSFDEQRGFLADPPSLAIEPTLAQLNSATPIPIDPIAQIRTLIEVTDAISANDFCNDILSFVLEDSDAACTEVFENRARFEKEGTALVFVEKIAGQPPQFRVWMIAPSEKLSRDFGFGFEAYRLYVLSTYSLMTPIFGVHVYPLQAYQYGHRDAYDRLKKSRVAGAVDLNRLKSADVVRGAVQAAFINLINRKLNI